MLLKDIRERWKHCSSVREREILWEHLTGTSGRWLKGFSEIAQGSQTDLRPFEEMMKEWHQDRASPARFCRKGYDSTHQTSLLDACFQISLLILQTVESERGQELISLARRVELPAGQVLDLAARLAGRDLRPAQQTISLTSLLVNQRDEGVPARLTLELITDGTGAFYPVPEFSFCRDRHFLETEAQVRNILLNHAASIDIRWNLHRLDNKDHLLGHLEGPSMGAAFSLGIHLLLNTTPDIEDVDIARVGVTAALDGNGLFEPVGGLWGKLDLNAMQLANLHTLVVAARQEGIPDRYLMEWESPFVIRARDTNDAIDQLLSSALPRRAVRSYEHNQCKDLEFRLPGKKKPMETHFQVMQIFRKASEGPESVHHGSKSSSNSPGTPYPGWIGPHKDYKGYEPLSLSQALTNGNGPADTAPRVLFLGTPGSGKTALTEYITWAVTANKLFKGAFVPARIRLGHWEKWSTQHAETRPPDYLRALYQRIDQAPSVDHWEMWLKQGSVVLLLDGVDEVTDEQWLRSTLQQVLSYRSIPIVANLRSVSFRLYEHHFEQFAVYRLGPLAREQRDIYIHQYPAGKEFNQAGLIERLDACPALQDLSLNPLFLSILCFAVDGMTTSELPEKCVGFLELFIDTLLIRPERVHVSYPAERPNTEDIKHITAHAALQLSLKGEPVFSGEALENALLLALETEHYPRSKPWVNALRKDLENNSGLLRGYRKHPVLGKRQQFFVHPVIQQYLCALSIYQTMNKAGIDAVIDLGGKKMTVNEIIDALAATKWNNIDTILEELREG